MSQFIDKLKSVSAGGLPPLGFRAAGAKSRPRMVLVAHIAEPGTEPDFSGADAVLVSVPKAGAKSPKTLFKAAPHIPWGGWLKGVGRQEVQQLGELGADFVVFPVSSVPRAILEEEKLGKIIEVEPAFDASLLRAIDDLPLDAVIVAGEKPSFSWRELMLLRRGANMLSKPLLVMVSPDVNAEELQALCEAGASGVVTTDNFDKLRRLINKLAPPKAGQRRKVEPLLPRLGGQRGTVAEEEEEEAEEDD
jgi:hypothetical protein